MIVRQFQVHEDISSSARELIKSPYHCPRSQDKQETILLNREKFGAVNLTKAVLRQNQTFLPLLRFIAACENKTRFMAALFTRALNIYIIALLFT